MSADEFDPAVERLFAQAPHFADSPFFEADVAARLNKASRVRSVALSAAGVVGGVIAVRELLNINFDLTAHSLTAQAGGQGVDSAGAHGVQSLLERTGLGDAALQAMGSMGDMQVFWGVAGVLVALLAAGAVKLSQQI